MPLPRGIISFSGKVHSPSGQSVLCAHNLNRQNFVEQRDTAEERGSS